ncbi:MAG: DUF4145 domain-containing protein [Bacteroidota bacterium]|jgi:hypothetical protein
MSKNFGAVIGIVVAIVIIYLLVDKFKLEEKVKELQKEIDENEDMNKEIRTRLSELIHNNKDIDPKISAELGQIVALLEIKQDTSAVMKLAKIIENLLKELYKGDTELKELSKTNGRKTPVFADHLEHAKNKKVISPEDFHLLSVMKIIRNEEAHDLAVHKDKSKIIAAFITGLGLILALCRMLKKKSLGSELT